MPFSLQGVSLIRPCAGGDNTFVFKITHLHGGVMPVAMDQTMLISQDLNDGLILFLGQLIGVGNAQLWLGGFNK
ncbi:hypothetical protein D3C73_1535180 [compost metagenome]